MAAWGEVKGSWGEANREIRTDEPTLGSYLRVHISKGSIDPGSMLMRGRARAGTGFKVRAIRAGADEAELRYMVRFPLGFDFVRGGKLPGLYGGAGNSGGRIPNGRDGFSMRLMWLSGGRGQVYAYLPTSQTYGTSLLQGQFRFVPGQWHRIRQVVRLNAPGRADGTVALWLDDRFVGESTSLRIRDVGSLHIDGLFVDVFFGGNDDSWAATEDTFIDFARFEIDARPQR